MTESAENQHVQVGWASRDITPARPVMLRGQFHVRISQAVRDPLTVTALALASTDEQCVMVSADRVGIPVHLLAGVREKLAVLASDLDPTKVFISATHTHTAPEVTEGTWEDQGPEVMSPGEYADLFIERTAECVAEAWRQRAPAQVGWAVGHAVVGYNRRQVKRDGASQMYGDTSLPDFSHIEGYEDHSVNMLFTYDGAGTLTGMVLNVACPSQSTESAYFVSADFWHEARCEVRQRYGRDLHILPQCSAAGDQSPHPMWNKAAEARMLKLKGLHTGDEDVRLAERVEIGNRIADAVGAVLPAAAKELHETPVLRHSVRTLELPRRHITEADVEEARAEMDKYTEQLRSLADRPPADAERSRCFARRNWYGRVIERFELLKTQPTYPMEMHVVRIGDIAFATNSFELYLDFGLRMKARSKALQTFVVQLAGPGTYLPSARSVLGKSYGSVPASNMVGPEGGDRIVEETLATIEAMFAPR